MKYLGIDYGTKKVGLAVSNPEGTIAFPLTIILSTSNLLNTITDLINKENIEKVVIGRSLNAQGEKNKVQSHIEDFCNALQQAVPDISVVQEDERGSSVAARAHLYSKGNIANQRWTGSENSKKREAVDAGAAAIILQRYLDRREP